MKDPTREPDSANATVLAATKGGNGFFAATIFNSVPDFSTFGNRSEIVNTQMNIAVFKIANEIGEPRYTGSNPFDVVAKNFANPNAIMKLTNESLNIVEAEVRCTLTYPLFHFLIRKLFQKSR